MVLRVAAAIARTVLGFPLMGWQKFYDYLKGVAPFRLSTKFWSYPGVFKSLPNSVKFLEEWRFNGLALAL